MGLMIVRFPTGTSWPFTDIQSLWSGKACCATGKLARTLLIVSFAAREFSMVKPAAVGAVRADGCSSWMAA